jgi:hypothetical protein
MKKLFFFGALIAAGLSFTACSSDKDVVGNDEPGENGGGRYLAISINLPTNPVAKTRTSDNGGNVTELADGLSAEYKVNNATLIIFDASGNFVEAQTIDTKPWTDSSDPQVTKVSTKVVQKVGGSVAANYQMLVILNHNNLIEVTSTNGLKVMTNGTLTDFSGSFADLTTQANKHFASTSGLDCGVMNSDGFYMANAPLADKPGSTASDINGAVVQVLVPITHVYDSESAASAGTADQIYVERGMAKVTMEEGIETATLSNSKIGGTTSLTASVMTWTIDNCNPNSYLVRSTNNHSSFLTLKSNSSASGAAVYRYIGNQDITEGSPSTYKYRTYFAESANYDKSGMDGETPTFSLNRVTGTTTFSDKFGDENPQYCFENTFSVDDQDVNKTTLVQVAIQAKNGTTVADLYTVNGNKTSIYDWDLLVKLIQEKAYEYIVNNGKVASGTFSSKDISASVTVDGNNKVTAIALSYDVATESSEGDATLKGSILGGTDGTGDATSGPLIAAVGTYVLSQTGDILKYVDGVSYYNIRIKHFGDLLTPWKNLETPQPSTGSIYPADNKDNNYLGRYGVLRNNWYNLKVKSIRSLGDATPHISNWPTTPDDELDNYITFQINILSWAKHVTQNADL